jgi:hypothetical protein
MTAPQPCGSCGQALDLARAAAGTLVCPACGASNRLVDPPTLRGAAREESGAAIAAFVLAGCAWAGTVAATLAARMLGGEPFGLTLLRWGSLGLGPVAAILGAVALREIRANPEHLKGRAFARGAIVLGAAAGAWLLASLR